MFLVSFLFDKLGYMPKFSIDVNHPFPCTQKEYVAPEFEKPVKKTVKKATTRKTTKK
jgi:hypothetical protein